MSLGKMNNFVDIIDRTPIKDSEGFTTKTDNIVASVRAYKEERHGSRKWANLAAFTKADSIFKFRVIPGIEVKPGMVLVCDDKRYTIVSVEKVREMYIEALAQKVDPSKG
jgi:hypothetical protein